MTVSNTYYPCNGMVPWCARDSVWHASVVLSLVFMFQVVCGVDFVRSDDVRQVRRLLDAGHRADAENEFGRLPEEVASDGGVATVLRTARKAAAKVRHPHVRPGGTPTWTAAGNTALPPQPTAARHHTPLNREQQRWDVFTDTDVRVQWHGTMHEAQSSVT